jgi:hypothetical protein
MVSGGWIRQWWNARAIQCHERNLQSVITKDWTIGNPRPSAWLTFFALLRAQFIAVRLKHNKALLTELSFARNKYFFLLVRLTVSAIPWADVRKLIRIVSILSGCGCEMSDVGEVKL